MSTNKNIKPRNAKDQPRGYWEIYRPHGYWEIYRPNGDLYYKCLYYNGKEIGYEEWYGYTYGDKLTKRYHL